MPKSKRAKVVSLTKVEKKTKAHKTAMMAEVQANADKWKYCWLFEVGNMRNTHLKTVRKLWKDTARLFFGRGAVMAKALGTTPEEEHRPGLHLLAKQIHGQVGLFFTDSPPSEVLEWFADFRPLDFARSGARAPRAVVLPAGPVLQHHSDPPEPLPHGEEPALRKLGLHTSLRRGVPTLDVAQSVCEAGDTLSGEQARLLKLLGEKTVAFKVVMRVRWEAETGELVTEDVAEELDDAEKAITTDVDGAVEDDMSDE